MTTSRLASQVLAELEDGETKSRGSIGKRLPPISYSRVWAWEQGNSGLVGELGSMAEKISETRSDGPRRRELPYIWVRTLYREQPWYTYRVNEGRDGLAISGLGLGKLLAIKEYVVNHHLPAATLYEYLSHGLQTLYIQRVNLN